MRLWKGVGGGDGRLKRTRPLEPESGWGEEDVPLTLYAHVYIDEQKLHAPHQEIFDIFLDECQWDE